jgi:F-type H+-transporting ATPase subunit b
LDRAFALKDLYMMGNLLIFASTGHGGIGLNTDIFESNVINLGILLALLFVYGRKVLTNVLNERRANIEAAIKDAESRQQQAANALAAAKEQLSKAKAEADKIRTDSVAAAAASKADIMAKAQADIARMQQSASADTNSERDRAIADLRQRVVALAMEKAEAQLTGVLDESAQTKLVDRSIALIGG